MVCTVYVVCTVCSLRFSMTVVAWMRVKAVYAIWNKFSANRFWIHSLVGFWIPMPTIPDSTSKNFLDSGILITLHGAKHYYEQTPATELAFMQLAEVFWSYISLCTAYGWNYPLSLGIQLINTLIVTFLDKFVLPGRNKHGINPPGSWEHANCSWLNKYNGRRR